MAASPKWKVYDSEGEYRASCKYVEDAAGLIASVGFAGWTLRHDHRTIVWTEGKEVQPAAESYDFVATTAHDRVRAAFKSGKGAAQ